MANVESSGIDKTHLPKSTVIAAMVGILRSAEAGAEQRRGDLPAGHYDHHETHVSQTLRDLAGQLGIAEAFELVYDGVLDIHEG